MKIRSFRDLDIWKLGKEIVIDTYKTTKLFCGGQSDSYFLLRADERPIFYILCLLHNAC